MNLLSGITAGALAGRSSAESHKSRSRAPYIWFAVGVLAYRWIDPARTGDP